MTLAALRLVHPFPSFLVAGVTVALLPFADSGAAPALYVQLGLGMLLYQFAIGATNDIADAADDAFAKPGKPLAAGRISARAARLIAMGCLLGGLAVTLPLDLGPWLIGVAGLSFGLVYNFWLKRTPFSGLPLSLALPLVPVWVFAAAGAWDALLWWTFPAGVLFGAAIHFAKELPDLETGRRSRGAAHLAGRRRAYAVALGSFGAGLSLVVIVLAVRAPAQSAFVAIAAVVAFSLAPRATRLFGRNGLFGIVSATTALAAIAFVSAL
jgi:4-hydroxybenzoate polyprenyltransferase